MERDKKSILLELMCLLSVCLFLTSCVHLNPISYNNRTSYPFSGNWQGNGIDSEGNEFTFAAKVIALGDNRYQVLILDKIDTLKKPMHIMDGVLKSNEFVYTADEELYVGGGKLDNEKFTGYYKGPVDGTYTMWRIESADQNTYEKR